MQHPNEDKKTPDFASGQQNQPISNPKSAYIGLTLMEYFKLSTSNEALQQIDEESNSSWSAAGTPCFADFREKLVNKNSSKLGRKDKIRTQSSEDLISLTKDNIFQPPQKSSICNFDQFGIMDKNVVVKLPSIYEQRHANNSRQAMVKDGKIANKKQLPNRNKNQQTISLPKNGEKIRASDINKNGIGMKKSIRTRMTSSSFYHANGKQKDRERIKTEEEIPDKNLEKSFVITKYAGNSYANTRRQKQDHHLQILKKHQNTFKMLKNIIN